jgi:undecaprenyl-diphosphatase
MPDINLLLGLLTKFDGLGNWFFFFLAFIESAPFVGVFIPGATLISIGGFLAYQDYLNPWKLIAFAALGAIAGDFFSYSLGRFGGDWIKNKKIISPQIIGRGEDFFRRYGNKSIFIGRFFGPIRAVIPFIAGVARMKRRPFIFWNVLSGISWAIVNVAAGYFSGTLIVPIYKKWSHRLSWILILLLMIAVIYWLVKRHGQSITTAFRRASLNFVERLNNYDWFQKLSAHYPIIPEFFRETNQAATKLFGTLLILAGLLLIYLLVTILDVL